MRPQRGLGGPLGSEAVAPIPLTAVVGVSEPHHDRAEGEERPEESPRVPQSTEDDEHDDAGHYDADAEPGNRQPESDPQSFAFISHCAPFVRLLRVSTGRRRRMPVPFFASVRRAGPRLTGVARIAATPARRIPFRAAGPFPR